MTECLMTNCSKPVAKTEAMCSEHKTDERDQFRCACRFNVYTGKVVKYCPYHRSLRNEVDMLREMLNDCENKRIDCGCDREDSDRN